MEMHIWINTFLCVFSRLSLFLWVLRMVETVGLCHNLVNQVQTEGGALTAAVQIIHQVGQDVQEERILLRMALFISQEQKNNAIQVHRTQRKVQICCNASSS
ncbi:UNVERIFIED_ORG: hypothetical protein J2W64_004965 [Rahnella aquatilis]|nr:hypothetical protein [Rahnella aquatilis]